MGPLSSSLSPFLPSSIPSVSNSLQSPIQGPYLVHFPKLSSFALEVSKFQISFHDLNIFTNSGVCCKSKSVSFPSSSASLGPVLRLREENYCLNLHQSVCLFLQFRGGRSFVPTLPKLDVPAQVSFSPETLITSSFKICIPPLLYFLTWYSERACVPSQPWKALFVAKGYHAPTPFPIPGLSPGHKGQGRGGGERAPIT